MSKKRKAKKSGILEKSLAQILKKIHINHEYDVPYIAGYSLKGTKIYIDRRLPKYMFLKSGRRVDISKYVALHEIVEKGLIKELGNIHYEYAHEVAKLAEENALIKARINPTTYNQFIAKYASKIENEDVTHPPPDLDLKPYRDEKDIKLLKALKKR